MTDRLSRISGVLLVAMTLLAVVVFVVVLVAPDQIRPQDAGAVRALRDDHELSVFYYRGAWLRDGVTPYGEETFQEYPQLGLAYITLPYLITEDYVGYRSVLIGLNLLCFLALAAVTLKLMRILKRNPRFILLLLLPSVLFFTFNRFDILVALIVQVSLLALLTRRFRWAFFLLAVAVLVKWYPALLLPLYYYYGREQGLRFAHRMKQAVLFFVVPLVLVLGGSFIMDGLHSLQPYLFHAGRSSGAGSLFNVLAEPILLTIGGSSAKYIGFGLFLFLQAIVPIMFVMFTRDLKKWIRSPGALVAWSALALIAFVLFARFYSPQWLLWFLPVLLLFVRRWYEAVLIIIYDICNYLAFPWIWQAWGNDTFGFAAVSFIMIALLTTFSILIVNRVWRAASAPPRAELSTKASSEP